jgi:hypothetical protein
MIAGGVGERHGGAMYMSTLRDWLGWQDVEGCTRWAGVAVLGFRGRTFLVVPRRGGHSCTITTTSI